MFTFCLISKGNCSGDVTPPPWLVLLSVDKAAGPPQPLTGAHAKDSPPAGIVRKTFQTKVRRAANPATPRPGRHNCERTESTLGKKQNLAWLAFHLNKLTGFLAYCLF